MQSMTDTATFTGDQCCCRQADSSCTGLQFLALKATFGGKTDGFRVKRPVFCFSCWPSDVAADEEQVRVELAAVVVAEQRQGRLEARTASFSRKLVRVRTYSTQAKPK